MKQFSRTVTLTFSVEHVSDDPDYETKLLEAVNGSIDYNKMHGDFGKELAKRGLGDPITAGGWSVAIEKE